MAGKGTPQQKQRDEKRVDELVRAGVAPGKAVQMVAEEYYGSVRGDSGASAGGSSVLHGSVNKDQQYASDELVLGNGSDKARFFTGGVSTQDDANNVLGTIRQTLGDSQRADMSYAYASNRLTAKADAQTAFYGGVVNGIHQVRQATAQRNANFTGFRGDLMTQEDWGRTISAHTQKWAQQDASDVVSLIAGASMLPMLAADLLVAGALAGRGALTLGRGLMNGADDLGRSLYSSIQANGIRGTVLNVGSQRVSWATVESANLSAMRQMVHQPAVLTTDAALNAASAFSWRTQYGGGLHLLKTVAANPNIQAGFVSGLANTSVDYYLNGSNANISASFIGGFAGGAFGSLAAQNLTSTIRPVVSGFIGGAVGEYMDQKLKGEDFNLTHIGLSAATGVLATVGVNKLFKVNTTVTVTPPNPAHSTSAAMTGGFVGSYSNSYFSNWYDQWFR